MDTDPCPFGQDVAMTRRDLLETQPPDPAHERRQADTERDPDAPFEDPGTSPQDPWTQVVLCAHIDSDPIIIPLPGRGQLRFCQPCLIEAYARVSQALTAYSNRKNREFLVEQQAKAEAAGAPHECITLDCLWNGHKPESEWGKM